MTSQDATSSVSIGTGSEGMCPICGARGRFIYSKPDDQSTAAAGPHDDIYHCPRCGAWWEKYPTACAVWEAP